MVLEAIATINQAVNNFVWGIPAMVCIIGVGLLLSVRTVSYTHLAKPQLFVKSLTFNGGTSLNLTPNSIVVFTGANNSGKSQVLKDLERFPDEDLQIGRAHV